MRIDTSPAMKFRCPVGHTEWFALADVQRRDMVGDPIVCRADDACWLPMLPVAVQGTAPRSNKAEVSAPGCGPELRTDDGVLVCRHCLVGNHVLCTGVGCFCGTAPSTRDAHRPGPLEQQLHGNALGEPPWVPRPQDKAKERKRMKHRTRTRSRL